MAAMYAFFAEHTNIPPKVLTGYTIEQIEFLMEGFNKNNKQDNPKGAHTLTGMDAINALMNKKI